jgi:hypothetical protein
VACASLAGREFRGIEAPARGSLVDRVAELRSQIARLMADVRDDQVVLRRVYRDIDDVTFWRRPMKTGRELAQLYLDADQVTFRLRATRARIRQLKVELAERSRKTTFH